MNNTSTRTARLFLLVLSILCAATSLPPSAAARAEARCLPVGGWAMLRLQRQKNPPKIADPQAPTKNTQPEVPWHFTVKEEDGESRHEIILSNPCAVPHLFRVDSSSEKLFRFEPPANNVMIGSNAPQTLTVIINPAAASKGLFAARDINVRVTVECLDCANDKYCTQIRKVLIAKVTVIKRKLPRASDKDIPPTKEQAPPRPTEEDASQPATKDTSPPTTKDNSQPTGQEAPQPPEKKTSQLPKKETSQLPKKGRPRPPEKETSQPPKAGATPPSSQGTNPTRPPAPVSDTEAEELSKKGPQFADTFDLNDFKFKAFLNNGWWLDFVYTLTQPATVTLTILVDSLPVVVEDFRMNAGWHEELIRLPNPTGKLGVATYSIKAVTDKPPAADVIPFTVLSMAAGELASASARGDRLTFPPAYPAPFRGARFTNAAYGFDPAPSGTNVPLGLVAVTFTPRDIPLLQGRPSANATFSFRAARTFSGGARADIRLIEGGKSTLVGGDLYEGQLGAGQTVSGLWNCMRDGSPSVGRHVLFVKAWFTLQAGGNWSFVHSAPLVVRR